MTAPAGPYPHERRILRYAAVALVLALAASAVQLVRGDARLLGLDVPPAASYGLLAVGAGVGAFALARRSTPVALGACAAIVLGVLPAGGLEAGLLDHALGLGAGLALLLFAELVHMTARYERAHRAVEKEGVPEDHINRVTDEAVRTLALRGALAAGVALAAILLAFALATLGPRAWRSGIETSAPLGVALVGLVLLGAASLVVLLRGARFPRLRSPSKARQETEPHVE